MKEIRWLGRERICQFHLKDNPHYLGEGKIDFPQILKAIEDIGFKGFANLETDSPSNVVDDDLARNLRFVRRLMADTIHHPRRVSVWGAQEFPYPTCT